jgi:hypothetical protein
MGDTRSTGAPKTSAALTAHKASSTQGSGRRSSKATALARQPDILAEFAEDAVADGLVGESQAAALVLLSGYSALLDRPASMKLVGPSGSGKSQTVETAIRYLPEERVIALTSSSARAFLYDDIPFDHKLIYLAESAALNGEFGPYVMRSLLSEGRLAHKTVEQTSDGLQVRTIEKEGPVSLVTTTTRASLEAELETRLVTVPVNDTPAQTRAIMLAQADSLLRPPVDRSRWHDLYRRVARGPSKVTIPFARALADAIPDEALRSMRWRRDFQSLLSYTSACALLHGASRRRAGDALVATVDDYRVARDLLADALAQGIRKAVSPAIRETVDAVRALSEVGPELPDLPRLAAELGLDRSTVSRRVSAAIDAGYVVNEQSRQGRPARLAIAEEMPADSVLLPDPCALEVVPPVRARRRRVRPKSTQAKESNV